MKRKKKTTANSASPDIKLGRAFSVSPRELNKTPVFFDFAILPATDKEPDRNVTDSQKEFLKTKSFEGGNRKNACRRLKRDSQNHADCKRVTRSTSRLIANSSNRERELPSKLDHKGVKNKKLANFVGSDPEAVCERITRSASVLIENCKKTKGQPRKLRAVKM